MPINEKLNEQANILFDNVAGWDIRTLETIGKRIKKIGQMSVTDIKKLNNISMLKMTQQDMDNILKDLAKITKLNISEIENIYSNALSEMHENNRYLYDYRQKTFIPFEENTRLQAITKAYARETANSMINLSKTNALGIILDDTFINIDKGIYNIIDKSIVSVLSGGDFYSIMRSTIEELGGSGARIDYGGFTRRLDTVIRQNLLWGAKQATAEYRDLIGEELGCDGIEIDWHSNPRPSHEFMQGKQYILGKPRIINGKYFESADLALARLKDYGCLHFSTPIICGVSVPNFEEKELKSLNEENKKPIEINGISKTGYGWKQNMRILETEARKAQEQLYTAKATGHKDLVDKYKKRIKAIHERYNQISKGSGIKAQPQRMNIVKVA